MISGIMVQILCMQWLLISNLKYENIIRAALSRQRWGRFTVISVFQLDMIFQIGFVYIGSTYLTKLSSVLHPTSPSLPKIFSTSLRHKSKNAIHSLPLLLRSLGRLHVHRSLLLPNQTLPHGTHYRYLLLYPCHHRAWHYQNQKISQEARSWPRWWLWRWVRVWW